MKATGIVRTTTEIANTTGTKTTTIIETRIADHERLSYCRSLTLLPTAIRKMALLPSACGEKKRVTSSS